MTLTIDGHNITSYIKAGGISWSVNTIDADGAGRNLDGEMQRKLVGSKRKLEVSCVPLTSAQMDLLTGYLIAEWLTVVLATSSGTFTYTMYPGATTKASYLMSKNSADYWEGFSFSLIEK